MSMVLRLGNKHFTLYCGLDKSLDYCKYSRSLIPIPLSCMQALLCIRPAGTWKGYIYSLVVDSTATSLGS